jgi:hypothetical protein
VAVDGQPRIGSPAAICAVALRRATIGAAMRRAKATPMSSAAAAPMAISSSVRLNVAQAGSSACARCCSMMTVHEVPGTATAVAITGLPIRSTVS